MLPFLLWLSPGRAVTADEVILAASAAAHILLVTSETTLPHVTAHAHLATRAMTHGKFAKFFWPGLALIAAAIAAPWLGRRRRPARPARPAGPRARLHPGRPVRPAVVTPEPEDW